MPPKHAAMTGLVFEHFDGQTAFYMALIPIAGIFVSLSLFRVHVRKFAAMHPAAIG